MKKFSEMMDDKNTIVSAMDARLREAGLYREQDCLYFLDENGAIRIQADCVAKVYKALGVLETELTAAQEYTVQKLRYTNRYVERPGCWNCKSRGCVGTSLVCHADDNPHMKKHCSVNPYGHCGRWRDVTGTN